MKRLSSKKGGNVVVVKGTRIFREQLWKDFNIIDTYVHV